MSSIRIVLSALFLVPAIALAGGDQGNIKRLFSRMKYEEALEAAEEVLKSTGMGPEELIEAYRWKGLCLSSLGRSQEAVTTFVKLLSIDPSYSLSEEEGYSPTQILPFYRAVKVRGEMGHRPIELGHVPPEAVSSLSGLMLQVELKSDPMEMVSGVQMVYRNREGSRYERLVVSVEGPGIVRIRLPDSIDGRELYYYFEAVNRHGGVLARAGSGDDPIYLRVVEDVPPPVGESGLSTWGWVAAGVGGALLVGGAVCGGMALSLDEDLSGSCPGGDCPAGREGDLDRLDALVLSTNVLLGAGAAVLASGVVLLLLDGDSGESSGSVTVVPTAGEGFIGASVLGRF